MRTVGMIWKLSAAVLLYLFASYCNAQAQKHSDLVSVVLTGGMVSPSAAEEICRGESQQENPRGVCFWGERHNLSVYCRETGGSCAVSCVVTTGNPELAVPGTSALAFRRDGCMIDKDTSVKLFGTENGSGQILRCQEASYVVCGTFESLRNVMVRPADDTEGDLLTMLALYSAKEGEAEQFLLRYGLEGEEMNLLFLQAFSHDMLLLSPVMCGMAFAGLCAKQGKSERSTKKKAALYLAAVFASSASVYLLYTQIQIPSDMIPTRWSDFSFWEALYQKQKKNTLLLLETAQGERYLDALWNLLVSLAAGFGSALAGMSFLLSGNADG